MSFVYCLIIIIILFIYFYLFFYTLGCKNPEG